MKLKKWKKFEKFLKKNDALYKYFNASYEPLSYINMHGPSGYIYNAFVWSETVEGSIFWDRLNRKWKKKLS